MYTLVEESSWAYRMLKSKFPEETVFYYIYDDGSYLDKAKTLYYDSKKNEIFVHQHDYYG